MVHYKVGYNFDFRLLDTINNLNAINNHSIIDEVYASLPVHAMLTARPLYRLPNIDMRSLETHIEKLHASNIKFYYTMNAPYIGSKNDIAQKVEIIKKAITDIVNCGVDGIIITNPVLARIVRENSDIDISISSIFNIFSANQIMYLNLEYGVKKICLSPYFNRSITMLETIQKNIASSGCSLELIVNELCSLGYNNGRSLTPCVNREFCFLCHSQNITNHDDELLDGFPQATCLANRSDCPPDFWAKVRIIRPEDIEKYEQIGIKNFKITGRTAKTDDIIRVVTAYMQRTYIGEIQDLWYMKSNVSNPLSNTSLSGLADYWFKNRNHSCDAELCGITCEYCSHYIETYGEVTHKRF